MNLILHKRLKANILIGILTIMGLFNSLSISSQGLPTPPSIITVGDFKFLGQSECYDYIGTKDIITIPTSYTYEGKEYKVTSVGHNGGACFYGSSVSKVIIPKGIATVFDAFENCPNLKEVEFQSDYPWMFRCFVNCPLLEKIIFTKNVLDVCMDYQSGKNIQILNPIPPKNRTNGCYDTLYVPSGTKAAYEMAGWKSPIIEFGEDVSEETIFVYEGIRYQKTSTTTAMVLGPEQGSNYNVLNASIPAKVPYEGVEYEVIAINKNAFAGCSRVQTLTLPDGIKKIGEEAFKRCSSLQKINIPKAISSSYYPSNIFDDCTNLKEIDVSANENYRADENVIYDATMQEIIRCPPAHLQSTFTTSSRIKRVREKAFYQCKNLVEVIFTEGVSNVGPNALADCQKLKSVTFPASLTQIYKIFGNYNGQSAMKEIHCKNETTPPSCVEGAFDGLKLGNMILYVPTNAARKIYKSVSPWNQFRYILKEGQRIAFTWANLSYGHVSEPEHTIEVTACENHSISEYIIPETIEKDGITYTVVGIGENAFDGCTHLQSVTIPASVTNIKDEAFANCTNLNAVHFKRTGTVPTIGSEVFKGLDMQAITAYVPKGCKKLYTDWGVFVNVVEEGEEPNQPASPTDATLKSLSYKIGDNGQVITIPEFDPNRYKYEVPYYSNEDAVGQGGSPVYSDAELESLRVYPVVEANNPNATVKVTDVLLRQCGFAKVNVISADGSKTNTYTFIMVSQKDAGKKYYVMMNLKNMTVQINGTTYKNGDIYKADHNENVTVKLIPDQGYKPPREMAIDEGSSTLIGEELTHGEDEINLGEINWHMGLILSAVKDEGQEDNTIFVHNNLKYRITGNNTVSVVGPDVAEGSGTQGNDNDSWTVTDCVIPSTITYNSTTYQVKTIEDGAFSGAINMKTITLPEGLETIGYEAFYRCYELKTLHIPASVTFIHARTDEAFFKKLDIQTITVASDNKVYTAQNGLLYNKNMTELLWVPYFKEDKECILPEGTTTIRAYAFAYQDYLTSVTLPTSLEKIGNFAFSECTGLFTIHFKGKQIPQLGVNVFENTNLEMLAAYVPPGCKKLYEEGGAFINVIEEEEDNTVSFTAGQLKYTIIADNEVAIAGVTDKTLDGYDIKPTVEYQNKTYIVTVVGERAFYECNNLVRFQPGRINMSLKTIGREAFLGCEKLTSILFNTGLKTIEHGAFSDCSSLNNLEIPASVTRIEEDVFDDCCKLANIAVNSGNKYYTSNNGVLYDKMKTTLLVYPNMRGNSYIIPRGVKRIENGGFYGCTNLKSITLNDDLESIGECAFDYCTGLKSLTIPASVKRIGLGIVDHCEETLEEIHSQSATPINLGDYPEYAFFYYSDKSDICKLYVPKGSKGVYSKTPGWKNFKYILEEGENPPLIPDKTDDEITLNTDSTYTDGEGNTGHFNGMIGNGEEETVINKLTIKGSATSTTTTITFNHVTVGNGSSTTETTTSVTKNTNVVIELIGDNSLGKLVNDGIAKLISKVEAALKNTVVINNGIFVDETGLLTRVEGAAELDITAPSDQEVRPGENVTLTASTKVSVTYAVTFIWEQLQPDGTWKAVGSPNVYTPARSGLRSATTVTDRLTIDAKDAGKYRCVIRNKVGDVSSTLTTPPATVTAKSTVDIVTPKSYRKVTSCGNQLHFEISTPTEVKIINLNGAIIRSVSLPAGDTYIDGLDKGVYILLFEDGVTQKVRI